METSGRSHRTFVIDFGVVHGNWVQAPFAFVTGLALGWMYYRTGSLLPGILMHFVNNSAAVLSFLLADARMPPWFLLTDNGSSSYGDWRNSSYHHLCAVHSKKLVPQPAVWHQPARTEAIETENNK